MTDQSPFSPQQLNRMYAEAVRRRRDARALIDQATEEERRAIDGIDGVRKIAALFGVALVEPAEEETQREPAARPAVIAPAPPAPPAAPAALDVEEAPIWQLMVDYFRHAPAPQTPAEVAEGMERLYGRAFESKALGVTRDRRLGTVFEKVEVTGKKGAFRVRRSA